ncbi:hypothetical protein D8I24_5678 [Cupriavidus necator H850]|uniref:hypothetical protein n=1 Tax=Cupriavidus necator TaxID=106590 RepID=UPI00129D973B|nr:hypothetical protein [Cupriavidus necator]KAI3598732.1 hypothetical protein D8I24_5678 [Cupriavidus necator H850]
MNTQFKRICTASPQKTSPTVLTTPGNYAAGPGEQVVIGRASQSGSWQLTLPPNPVTGQVFTFKDGARTAASFNVQFIGQVDGVTNPVFSTNGFSRTLIYNGVEWNVTASA